MVTRAVTNRLKMKSKSSRHTRGMFHEPLPIGIESGAVLTVSAVGDRVSISIIQPKDAGLPGSVAEEPDAIRVATATLPVIAKRITKGPAIGNIF